MPRSFLGANLCDVNNLSLVSKTRQEARCLFRRRNKISRKLYGTASAKLACLLPKIITLEHSASAPGGNFDEMASVVKGGAVGAQPDEAASTVVKAAFL